MAGRSRRGIMALKPVALFFTMGKTADEQHNSVILQSIGHATLAANQCWLFSSIG